MLLVKSHATGCLVTHARDQVGEWRALRYTGWSTLMQLTWNEWQGRSLVTSDRGRREREREEKYANRGQGWEDTRTQASWQKEMQQKKLIHSMHLLLHATISVLVACVFFLFFLCFPLSYCLFFFFNLRWWESWFFFSRLRLLTHLLAVGCWIASFTVDRYFVNVSELFSHCFSWLFAVKLVVVCTEVREAKGRERKRKEKILQ